MEILLKALRTILKKVFFLTLLHPSSPPIPIPKKLEKKGKGSKLLFKFVLLVDFTPAVKSRLFLPLLVINSIDIPLDGNPQIS